MWPMITVADFVIVTARPRKNLAKRRGQVEGLFILPPAT
jgi:hypothetical protein